MNSINSIISMISISSIISNLDAFTATTSTAKARAPCGATSWGCAVQRTAAPAEGLGAKRAGGCAGPRGGRLAPWGGEGRARDIHAGRGGPSGDPPGPVPSGGPEARGASAHRTFVVRVE